MKRLFRIAFNLLAALSLLVGIAVCVLWVRSRTGSDQVEWRYDRYLADRSAANTVIEGSSNNRIWLNINWGQVGPFNGQLVWGYHINADQSGGRPRLTFRREGYRPAGAFMDADNGASVDAATIDDGTSGWGPLRWQTFARSDPSAGERFQLIRIGASHWLLALLFFAPPMLWLNRARKARRRKHAGLCPKCGYDLRATPDRCPECGTTTISPATGLLQPRREMNS